MDAKAIESYRKAGELAARAREHGATLVKEGAKLVDVADTVEAWILAEGEKFGQEGESLYAALRTMVDNQKDMKLFLFDTAHPDRAAGQTLPLAHDNVGIRELRAGTRLAGRAMPVSFTATVANYSAREADVTLVIFDDATEKEKFEVDPMQMRIPANESVSVSFEVSGSG